MKMKTILLDGPRRAFQENVQVYRVTKITDSVEFEPGAELSKKEVEELCQSPQWKVVIVKT